MSEILYPSDFIMSPKVDFVFKELMTNAKVRKGFLSAVLNIKDTDIKDTKLENTNLRVIHENEKLSILDVRVLMNDNTEIDIEIQLAYYGTWAERAAFYLSKMLSEQTGINSTYSNIKKCVGINILDFKFTKDDRFYKTYHIREDKTSQIFTDILEWHIIELPKLPEKTDGTTLYNWAKFIKTDKREELKMIAEKDDYINEAFKHLEIVSQNKEKQIEYTSRLKALMDYNTIMEERYEKGRQEGIEIGEKKGRQEGIEIGEKKGRQELLKELMEMGITLPNELLGGVKDEQ